MDTTRDAHEAQIAGFRRLSGPQRVELAVRLSEDTRAVAQAGIASRHPEYTATDVTLALARLLLGDELFRRVHPGAPLLAP